MKAVSLWQPWASAISTGLKRIETRGRRTSHRGPIAIHAAKRFTNAEKAMWHERILMGEMHSSTLPFGAVVAIADLVECMPSEIIYPVIPDLERSWGAYGAGRWCWLLANIKPLRRPFKYAGQQGMFEISDELIAAAL